MQSKYFQGNAWVLFSVMANRERYNADTSEVYMITCYLCMYMRFIGVGRFTILGWGGGVGGGWGKFRILGGARGGGEFPDVTSTSFRCHVPTRFLINQCQIITFIILKSDIIENSRIELRGIVLPVPSNQIKVTFIIILPSTWYNCDFFSCFT